MNTPRRFSWKFPLVILLSCLGLQSQALAQITNTLFADGFSGTSIDTKKFAIDSPFFEGGKGDIAPSVHDGVLEFTGTVSEQWWAGATLRVLQTFDASVETNIVVSVDRLEELPLGEATASRSALWIMDSTRTKFVLFADVVNEGGWHYNRYIGQAGDARTGGGTDIAAFNGVNEETGLAYDDQGQHQMAAVIDGKEVKLYLDGRFGTAVAFPFSPVVIQLGSYARANNDPARTVFDNLKIEAVRTATFSLSSLTMGLGQTAQIAVRIPEGANTSQAIPMQIISSRPAVAAPAGATDGTLTLTFEQGGPNTKTFDLQGLTIGNSQITLANDAGVPIGNSLAVAVQKGATVLMEDTFAGAAPDASKWRVNNQSFETGFGTFDVAQTGGTLQISGFAESQYWPGASLQTVGEFGATADLPLVFEVDRVAIDRTSLVGGESTAARSGVFITSYDGENNRVGPWVFFGQDLGETGWQVNVEPGNPTGSGTAVPAFADLANDTGNHRMRIRADGTQVEVFLDGVSGGTFAFPSSAFIKFELAAFARDIDDGVKATFDNVKIENVLPCVTVAPTTMLALQGDSASTITVTIPALLNVSGPANVTVTSRNPSIAEPVGAVNGALTLSFPVGTSARTINVSAKSAGSTVFDITNDQGACMASGVEVSVTPPPVSLVSDDFSGTTLDTAKWTVDDTPLVEGGTLTADSAVKIADGMALLDVTSTATNWPGFTVWSTATYDASAASPILFEIDRVRMEYQLVGGTDTKQRAGIWVKSGTNFVFLSDFGSYNATFPGWQFHRVIGAAGDVPLGDLNVSGTYIPAFSAARHTDQGNHRMRIVVNGATAKLFLDGVLGVEVPFPFSEDLVFGFGTYANFTDNNTTSGAGNPIDVYWDNALIQGFPDQPTGTTLSVARQGANIVITWTGTGTLQSTESLVTGQWTDVTPAPTGNTFTVAPGSKAQTFYRIRQ